MENQSENSATVWLWNNTIKHLDEHQPLPDGKSTFAGSSEARFEPWPKRLSFQDLMAHQGGLERTQFRRQDHAGKLLGEAG